MTPTDTIAVTHTLPCCGVVLSNSAHRPEGHTTRHAQWVRAANEMLEYWLKHHIARHRCEQAPPK